MKPINQETTSGIQEGLIISYFGNSVAVEDSRGQVLTCHLHRNRETPVVGDRVHWKKGKEGQAVIVEVLARHSVLGRGNDRGQMKLLAANIDIMLIVMAPPPIFSEYLLDRYLAAAEILTIQPIIVLNKIDLLNQAQQAAVLLRLQPYQAIYPVILTSLYAKQGLEALGEILNHQSAVLVGPSGVGKSSMIAAFVNQAIQVTPVSPKGTGKHTTTATRLYHLPGGGNLIDSPGVREFNLWPVNHEDLLRGFKEFKPYLSGCQFRDCRHVAEPGCQLRQAVERGTVSLTRYENFQTLANEARLIMNTEKYTKRGNHE